MNNLDLICPNCRSPLARTGASFKCVAGHCFDVAREGYVNLVTGKAPSATQGDNLEMLQARRAFLARGYYRQLAQALAQVTASAYKRPTGRVVVDVGCGEGYYLGEITADPRLGDIRAYGTDISKAGIAMAAKTFKQANFVVADTNTLLPFGDGAVDVILDVFAPRNAAEFARVLRPGGKLIIAIPTPDHLLSLRERFRLLDIEPGKPEKIKNQLASFEYLKSVFVEDTINLDTKAMRELLEMTPNARHIDEATRAELEETLDVSTVISFEILLFSRSD